MLPLECDPEASWIEIYGPSGPVHPYFVAHMTRLWKYRERIEVTNASMVSVAEAQD